MPEGQGLPDPGIWGRAPAPAAPGSPLLAQRPHTQLQVQAAGRASLPDQSVTQRVAPRRSRSDPERKYQKASRFPAPLLHDPPSSQGRQVRGSFRRRLGVWRGERTGGKGGVLSFLSEKGCEDPAGRPPGEARAGGKRPGGLRRPARAGAGGDLGTCALRSEAVPPAGPEETAAIRDTTASRSALGRAAVPAARGSGDRTVTAVRAAAAASSPLPLSGSRRRGRGTVAAPFTGVVDVQLVRDAFVAPSEDDHQLPDGHGPVSVSGAGDRPREGRNPPPVEEAGSRHLPNPRPSAPQCSAPAPAPRLPAPPAVRARGRHVTAGAGRPTCAPRPAG